LIIDGLRAELIERIIDMDKSFTRAAAIQNRMLKSLSGLAAVDQHEAQWRGRQAAGELDYEAQQRMIDSSDIDLPNPQESDDEPDLEGDPAK
jgi:hypothetical protein